MKNQKVKEEIVDSLKGDRKLKCPYCGCYVFKRVELTLCYIWERGEVISDDDISNTSYTYSCNDCKKKIEEDEL